MTSRGMPWLGAGQAPAPREPQERRTGEADRRIAPGPGRSSWAAWLRRGYGLLADTETRPMEPAELVAALVVCVVLLALGLMGDALACI